MDGRPWGIAGVEAAARLRKDRLGLRAADEGIPGDVSDDIVGAQQVVIHIRPRSPGLARPETGEHAPKGSDSGEHSLELRRVLANAGHLPGGLAGGTMAYLGWF